MTPADLLTDAFSRVLGVVESVLDGADDALLAERPTPDSNSIGWLVWHLTRVQDDHVADVAGSEQVWTAGGYAERFDLPLPTSSAVVFDGHRVPTLSETFHSLVAGVGLGYHVHLMDRDGEAGTDDPTVAAAEWEAINARPARELAGLRRLMERPSAFDA